MSHWFTRFDWVVSKKHRRARCADCGSHMHSNGKNRKGQPTWRCPLCGKTKSRAQKSHQTTQNQQVEKDFRLFLEWIQQYNSLDYIARIHGVSRRSLDYRFAPFWMITVPQPTCDHAFDQIFIDGTYLGSGKRKICLLIARSKKYVLAWRWCLRETKNDYLLLLDAVKRPRLVTLDGHYGAIQAVKVKWPGVRIQRCLVHIYRNVIRETTQTPRTTAHKALKRLGQQLKQVKTSTQAYAWCESLRRFEQEFHDYMLERTYRTDVTDVTKIPRHVRADQQWWYRHQRTRRAFRLLKRCLDNDELFAFLEVESSSGTPLSSTTNSLEGGANSVIKGVVHRHRGMPVEHVRRVVDWTLFVRSVAPVDPVEVARSQEFGQVGLRLAAAQVAQEQAAADDRGVPKMYGSGLEDYQPIYRLS